MSSEEIPKPPASFAGAVLMMLTAAAMFACLDTTTKYLTRELPVMEVVWGRYLTHLILMIVVLGPLMRRRLVRYRRPGLQVLRALLMLGSTALAIWGFSYLPLAEAATIGFATPILVTALSVPLLGERVGPRRWAAVGVGFLGVVIVMRPGTGALHWASFIMLAMAVDYALFQILTRVLGQTEDPYASQFMAGIVGTAVSALTLPFVWVMPSWEAIGLLFFAGFMGGTGHLMMIKAYGRAPASVLVPFTYSALIWVSFTGWLVFDEVPDAWTFSGMAVIASAGIYIAHRESKLRRVWEPSKPRE